MTKRENRVITAFINCVRRGEYTYEYACILIEDTSKYGWLTDEAKETFYAEYEKIDAVEKTTIEKLQVEEIPTEEITSEVEENLEKESE